MRALSVFQAYMLMCEACAFVSDLVLVHSDAMQFEFETGIRLCQIRMLSRMQPGLRKRI
jgi:hypothetical protein